MRRTIKLFTLTAAIALFAASAFAQVKECNEENKAAWYQTFLDNFRKEPPQQKIAYDAAKQYLTSCPEDPNDQQYKYMKEKFVIPYEAMQAGANTGKQFDDAVKSKNYAEQLRVGKQLLVTSPDNTLIYIYLGQAGLGDAALLGDSAPYAKKAIELIEGGKPFAPFTSKDQALASLNYALAKATVKTDPTGAIPYFVKAAKYDSDLKKNPLLYSELAAAYGEGPVAKLSDDYKKFVGQPESPETKLALANLNQAIDRQIDAFARAAAYSTNPAYKKAVMDVLTGLYKDRNQSVSGLDQLIAGITSKPLPDLPTPITSLPSTPTTTTGGSPTGNNGAMQSGTTGGPKPAGNSGPAGTAAGTQTTKTGPGAKPAASPTPKPPRRSNHRRG